MSKKYMTPTYFSSYGSIVYILCIFYVYIMLQNISFNI